MLMDGPSTFQVYVDAHGGWQSAKASEGLGANVCESCGGTTDRFVEDKCEDCARWEHGYDQGEAGGIAAVIEAVLRAVEVPTVRDALKRPGI